MADTKTSALTLVTDPQATDYIYIVDGATSKRIALEELLGKTSGLPFNPILQDGQKYLVGTGSDGAVSFNGTDMLIDYDVANAGTTDFRLQEDGTDRFVVLTGGDFEFSKDNSLNGYFSTYNNTNTKSAILYLRKAGGTIASPTVVADGESLGGVYFQGYSGAATDFVNSAAVLAQLDGTPDSAADTTDMPGRLLFYTVPDGSNSLTERVRIDNAGNFGIGKTPATLLDVAGNFDLEGYGAVGNGQSLGSHTTLIIDRDFSGATIRQLTVAGIGTATSGTNNLQQVNFDPEGTVINSGGAHGIVSTLTVVEPAITETSGSATIATTVYIQDAPTEGGSNYALFVDAGDARFDGNVAIGLAAAESSLHVSRGAGGSAAGANDILTLEDATHAYINIINGASDSGGLMFSDATRARGQITYSHATDGMGFVTAGSTRMTLASTGELDLVSGPLTVGGNFDLEGYGAVGNGSAVSSADTLVIDRDFSSSGGHQLHCRGVITASGGTSDLSTVRFAPDGTVINSGGAHGVVATLRITEPAITETSGSATIATTVHIANAPTEGGSNYALFVDAGDVRFDGYVYSSVTSGITASVTQTQGQQALTTSVNEVATVANTNDTVTLPSAVIGLKVVVINNGANTLQVFPASGDNINGGGVDTASTIAAANNVTFMAYDVTNWEAI